MSLRGTGFGRLWAANAVSNVGDGVTLAAGPSQLRGRVNSVYYFFGVGGFALGALQGGFVAQAFGITAPFWLAFGVMVVFTACAWRLFSRSALDSERQQVVLSGAP